jgi:tetratricopeptide (TPR) repeat protein
MPVTSHAEPPEKQEVSITVAQVKKLAVQLEQEPDNLTLRYNYGVALYKNGEFTAAAQAFARSAQQEKNSLKRADSEYNHGRALFADAKLQQDTNKKKQTLQQAGAAFRQALEDNPNLTQARRGIQEYRKEIKKIKQQQKDKPQEQKQDSKDQQKQNSQNQEGKESKESKEGKEGKENVQNKLNKASKKQRDLQNKNPSSKEGKPSAEQMQEMAKQQKDLRQQLEDLKKEMDKKPKTKDQSQQLQKAIDKQKEAEESLKQGKAEEAKKQQQEAADKIDQTAQAMQKSPPEEEPQPEQMKQDEDTAAKPPSKASEIIENERRLHELRREQMRHVRPYKGKDW